MGGGGVLRVVDPARTPNRARSETEKGKKPRRWPSGAAGYAAAATGVILGGGVLGLGYRVYKARTAGASDAAGASHPLRAQVPIVKVRSLTTEELKTFPQRECLVEDADALRDDDSRDAGFPIFVDFICGYVIEAIDDTVQMMGTKFREKSGTSEAFSYTVSYAPGDGAPDAFTMRVRPVELEGNHSLARHYPAIFARAIFMAFEQFRLQHGVTVVATVVPEAWHVEVLFGDSDSELQSRYTRALAAASRVVTYCNDGWDPAHAMRLEDPTSTPKVERARETAIELCAERHAGIMIACARDPGVALSEHGVSVFGAWLRGECGASEVCKSELLKSTIALRGIGLFGGMDDLYGCAWVVRGAKIDTPAWWSPTATATLVFTIPPPPPPQGQWRDEENAMEAREGLVQSVRAGLDAMIVEGVLTAIVAPARTDEVYIGELEGVLNSVLDETSQPSHYAGSSAVTGEADFGRSRRACFSRILIPALLPPPTARATGFGGAPVELYSI